MYPVRISCIFFIPTLLRHKIKSITKIENKPERWSLKDLFPKLSQFYLLYSEAVSSFSIYVKAEFSALLSYNDVRPLFIFLLNR